MYRETPSIEAGAADLLASTMLVGRRMAEVVARDDKFVRVEEAREVGLQEYADQGEFMKVHFLESVYRSRVRRFPLYKNGGFTDLPWAAYSFNRAW